MTAAQSFKIYEILGKYFNNAEDAKIVVSEMEQIIDVKVIEQKDIYATKEDLAKQQQITIQDIAKLQQLISNDFSKFQESNMKTIMQLQIDIEKRFNQLIIWIVGTVLTFAGIIIAFMKL